MRLDWLRWQVGLSNGENFIEGKVPFDLQIGKLSPWLRLKEYVKKNGIKITSLSLIYKDRSFNLPSAGNNPKHGWFLPAEKPINFEVYKPFGIDAPGKIDSYKMIEAQYENYKLQLWVDQSNPNNCWTLVK